MFGFKTFKTPPHPPRVTREQLDQMPTWEIPNTDLSGGKLNFVEGTLKEYIVAAIKQSREKEQNR